MKRRDRDRDRDREREKSSIGEREPMREDEEKLEILQEKTKMLV